MFTYIGFSNYSVTYIIGQLKTEEMICDININYADLSKSDQTIIDNFINYIISDNASLVTIDNCAYEFIGNITCSKTTDLKVKKSVDFSQLTTTQKNKINNFFTCLINNKHDINTDIITGN